MERSSGEFFLRTGGLYLIYHILHQPGELRGNDRPIEVLFDVSASVMTHGAPCLTDRRPARLWRWQAPGGRPV